MFCKNCGKELNNGAKVCPNCGTKVTLANALIDIFKSGRRIWAREGELTQNDCFAYPQVPEEAKSLARQNFDINYEEQNPSVLKVPHITASLANGAKAVKTKDLDFEALEKPIKLVGRFGYWIKDADKEYISYEPYIRTKTEMDDGWDR